MDLMSITAVADTRDLTALLAAEDQTRMTLRQTLRDQFPFLYAEALESIVESTIKSLRDELYQQMPVMAASKSRINFFSLPAELRNYVYELALMFQPGDKFASEVLVQKQAKDRTPRSQNVFAPRVLEFMPAPQILTPALLCVSRQVRLETLPLYYSCSRFEAKFSDGDTGHERDGESCLKNWLEKIGKKRAAQIEALYLMFCMNERGLGQDVSSMLERKHLKSQHVIIGEDENGRACFLFNKKHVLRAFSLLETGIREEAVKVFTVELSRRTWKELKR